MNVQLFKEGMKQVLPVSVPSMIDGMVFGMLARQTGLSVAEALMFSLFVNAGSSQFAAIGLLSQGILGWPTLVSAAFLNSRQLLYGLALGPAFPNTSFWKLAVMSIQLSDETYALTVNRLSTGYTANRSYFMGAGLTDYIVWNGSTLLGAVFGSLIKHPQALGLDFAFLATFLGFLAIQIKNSQYLKAAFVSSAAACMAYPVWGTTGAVIIGGICSIMMGVIWGER